MPRVRETDGLSGEKENLFIAEKLDEVADLLSAQGAGPYRVRAYREAADYVGQNSAPMREVFGRDGRQGLEDLPTIGHSIAAAIIELLETGRLGLIERLRGDLDPEALFLTVPMIGPKLAETIHERLGLGTLEDLEVAAHDGRLEALPGIGARRLRSIQHSLAEILARRRPKGPGQATEVPPVDVVLDVDAEYRLKAEQDRLPRITPRRFNPDGTAWLPILHTGRGAWRFTALYSNTPNAHRLGRTKDWVVIYFEKDGTPEGQCTVVTETRGILTGRRVVRGREREQNATARDASTKSGDKEPQT